MSATPWWHEVDYQDDLAAALAALQQTVLDAGEYQHPWNDPWRVVDDSFEDEMLREASTMNIDAAELEVSIARLKAGEAPLSLAHLFVLNTDVGSHSILDVFGIGDEILQITPLSPAQCERLYGTQHPTIEQIREHEMELLESRQRWTGTAAVAYEDGTPTHIVFAGSSGD